MTKSFYHWQLFHLERLLYSHIQEQDNIPASLTLSIPVNNVSGMCMIEQVTDELSRRLVQNESFQEKIFCNLLLYTWELCNVQMTYWNV